MTAFLLVHGAWHGPWCWEKVAGPLRAAGHEVVATELHRGDLAADTAAVQRDVDALAGRGDRLVVCAHSYGGAVATGLALPPEARLAYLAAYLLDEGETVRGVAEQAPPVPLGRAMRIGDDGACTLDPELAPDALYGGCAPDDVAWALARLQPQALACFVGSPGRTAWREAPATYVVCTQDRAVHPDSQRQMAARAARTVEWDAGHSPFLSTPDRVVELLTGL